MIHRPLGPARANALIGSAERGYGQERESGHGVEAVGPVEGDLGDAGARLVDEDGGHRASIARRIAAPACPPLGSARWS